MSKLFSKHSSPLSKRSIKKKLTNDFRFSKFSNIKALENSFTPKPLRKDDPYPGTISNKSAVKDSARFGNSSFKILLPERIKKYSPLIIEKKKKSCCSERDDFIFKDIKSLVHKEKKRVRVKSLENLFEDCEKSLKHRDISLPKLNRDFKKLKYNFEAQRHSIELFQTGASQQVDHILLYKHQENLNNRIKQDTILIKEEISKMTDQSRIDNKIFKLATPSYSRKTLEIMKSFTVKYKT